MSGKRGGAVGQTYRRTEERVSIDLYTFFSCLQTIEDEPNVSVNKERLISLLNEQQQQKPRAATEEHLRAYRELADKVKELEKQLTAKKTEATDAPTTSGASATMKRARASSSSSTSSTDSEVTIIEDQKKKEADVPKEMAKKKKKE